MLAPVLSVLLMALGLALIVRTIQLGVGGGEGFLFGGLLLLVGALRLYLSFRVRR